MDDKQKQLFHSGDKSIDATLRGRLSRILSRQVGTVCGRNGNANGLLRLEAKENQFNVYENVDGSLFHDCFEIARSYLKNGELVDLHGIETTEYGIGYNDCFNYLSEDGLSGFSITPDGDLISVFNASGKNGFLRAIAPIVKEKAKTLDCYVSEKQNLMGMYEHAFSFKTASLMDYNMEYDHDNISENHGNPQVAFMVNTEAEVETREFSAEDYDAAVEYRNSYVDKAGLNDSAFSNAEDTAFDEPDLTDTSELDPYERVVRRMNGEQFDRTPQHERVEQTAQKLGRKLYWDCRFGDGYIDSDGNIHLAPNTEDPIFKVFKHDLTHYLEKNERLYNLFANAVMDSQVFKDWVKSKGYNSTAEFVEAKKALYEEAEKERQRTNPEAPQVKCDNPDAEILADFVGEKLFGGEHGLTDKLMGEMEEKPRRSFFEAVKDWFAKIKRAMLGTKEIKTIEQAEDAFLRTYKAVQKSVEKGKTGGSVEYSYAGVNSRTADKSLLLKAQSMLDNGADSETVRKETGWFKGYDGKWRFEIDDFDSYLVENPKLEKHTDGNDVYFTGKLSDILNHKELFKAYPQLKDINIIIQTTDFGVEGIYQKNSNYITLSIEQFKRYTKEYHDYLNGDRKAEIERIEQTPEYQEYNKLFDDPTYDEMNPAEWLELETAVREKFYSSELGKRYHELKWGKNGFTGEKFEFGWDKGAKAVLMHEVQHAVQSIEDFASGASTNNSNYDRVAGEIESRDVEKRLNYSAEQRKNTRPDIDRTDVVFADGSTGISLSKDISEYPYNMQSVNSQYMQEGENNSSDADTNSETGDFSPESGDKVPYSISERSFENNAYTEYNKPITLDDIKVLRSIGRKSINAFTAEEVKMAQKWAYKFYKQLGTKSPFFRRWFGDWRANDDGTAKFKSNIQRLSLQTPQQAKEYFNNGVKNKTLFRGDVKNDDTGFVINVGAHVYNDTLTYSNRELSRHNNVDDYQIRLSILSNIQTIVKFSILFDTEIALKGDKESQNMYQSFFHKFYTIAEFDGKQYLVKLTVDELNSDSTTRRAYNVNDIKISPVAVSQVYKPADTTDDSGDLFSTISISDLFNLVKNYDADFTPKPVNKALIENGKPKVFYHGAKKNGGFTEFRSWQYFTDNKTYAERYAERGNENSLYEVFLTANKIFDTRDEEAKSIFEKIRQEYGLGELQDTGLPDWTDGYDLSDYLDEHPELGYDAIILDEGGDLVDGKPVSRGESIVIKDSTQIKSATDNIGTFDKSNPDVRYSIPSRTAADLLEQYEQGKITKEEYLSRITKQKTDSPGEIARLMPKDASTTPTAPEVTDSGELNGESSFYTNAKEKSKFVNETVKRLITDDKFIKNYAAITNRETLRAAAEKLNEGGERFVNEWFAKPPQDMTAEDISVGLILIERYQCASFLPCNP